jgi:predicted phosphodiesterase
MGRDCRPSIGNSPEAPKATEIQAELAVEDWINAVLSKASQVAKQQTKPIASDKSSLVLCIGDTHFGQLNPEYNCEIASERLIEIPNKLKTKHALSAKTIDEIVVVLLGDIVENEAGIYDNQSAHVECPVIEQIQKAIVAIWSMLVTLHKAFPKTAIRIETVPGNHGRVSKRAHEHSNWDNFVYMSLALLCSEANIPTIAINYNPAEFLTFLVKDHTVVAVHKGPKHTGTPAMRIKYAGHAEAKDYDIFLQGHWHNLWLGNWLDRLIFANGSLCGANTLSERLACINRPRQGFFLVTPGEPVSNFSFLEW